MERSERRLVLVLDADMVPALTIARSLYKRNCTIHVAAHIEKPIACYSRSVDQHYLCPNPLSAPDDFLHWLARHCEQHQYDLVIPVTERTLVPISTHRDRFEKVHLAIPSAESLELALDKEQTIELARSVDVAVPGSVTIGAYSQLDDIIPSIQYPVVLKPARSLGSSDGGASQLKVSYAFDEVELRAGCRHALHFGPILLQQYVRGLGVGIELIASKGEVKYAFQHLRLHEVPLTGGGSSLRKSQPIEPVLLQAAERLMSALKWDGVAMVEFKYDPDSGALSLMEINGRFWGSLPLADAAGADFPAMLLALELDGDVGETRPYRDEVYCRKLSSDLYWYESALRRSSLPRIVEIPGQWTILRDLYQLFLPRHYFDVQSFTDPLPGLVDLRDIFASYAHRAVSLMGEKWYFFQQRRNWTSGRVADSLSSANQILFLCYGNINRSALADELLRGYAEDAGISVISAGLHPEQGRPADPAMVEVASGSGVDLASSRSLAIDRQLLADSDVVFAMEKRHADAIIEVDPACADRVYLLGAACTSGPAEIQDPYGGAKTAYRQCFDRVAEAVDRIKSIIMYSMDS
jgi:protein-tyrosine-phosphatase/predicted ATP-grasp superfamily ATP-dependent carboligase